MIQSAITPTRSEKSDVNATREMTSIRTVIPVANAVVTVEAISMLRLLSWVEKKNREEAGIIKPLPYLGSGALRLRMLISIG